MSRLQLSQGSRLGGLWRTLLDYTICRCEIDCFSKCNQLHADYIRTAHASIAAVKMDSQPRDSPRTEFE
jgi:hypothetical protein